MSQNFKKKNIRRTKNEDEPKMTKMRINNNNNNNIINNQANKNII